MLKYVSKRILSLIPVIICVSFIVFALMDLAPGTIIDSLIFDSMSDEDVAALRAQYDLDKPMVYRYGKYMYRLIQGDLGVADISRISVWEVYISRLPNTLYLALAAFGIGSAISIPMGINAAKRAGKVSDLLTTTFTLIGISMPGFWLGFLLLMLFSVTLGWLPAGGISQGVKSFILPAFCSGLLMMASSTRQTRSSMLEVLNSDYLRTARAKGVPEKVVIRKHALGNAWIPILTTMGGALSISLAGSAIVESVFAWPGVGRATVEAVLSRDVTATCGYVIMTTILYVLIQLLVDIMYAFVDPRIKTQYAGSGKKRKGISGKIQATGDMQNGAFVLNNKPAPEILPDFELAATETGITGTSVDAGDSANPQSTATDQVTDEILAAVESVDDTVAGSVPVSAADNARAFVTKPEQDTDIYSKTDATRTDSEVSNIMRKYRKRSRLGEIWHSISKNKSAMAGLIIIVLMILVFLVSLFISFDSVTAVDTANSLQAPSRLRLFGTDNLGRNMFLRTLFGSRYSLVIGIGTVAIGAVIGIIFGSIAAYFGGKTDDLIMRGSDILASIPGLLLGMVIITVLGQNLQNLIIAVGVTTVPIFIRITRASVLTVRNHEFVEASRAIGIPTSRIIFSQVLPNGLSPIIVTITGSLGMSIIVAASLSFLGFGVPIPHPEWGALVSAGRNYIRIAPWLITFPGVFIMITVLGFNLLGDGLRDALDPKLKR